jgi:hypothetical protein
MNQPFWKLTTLARPEAGSVGMAGGYGARSQALPVIAARGGRAWCVLSVYPFVPPPSMLC